MLINKNIKKIFTVGVLSLVIISCGKEEEKAESKLPRLVRYQVVSSSTNNFSREFTGNVVSENEAQLSFKVGGTIVKKNVKLGHTIKKGDILAELDTTDYLIAEKSAKAEYQSANGRVLEAIAQLNQAKVSLNNNEKDLARVEKLYYDNNVSKKDYDNAQANRDVSKAQVNLATASVSAAKSSLGSARAQLRQAETNLSYTKLISPTNGYISQEDKAINEIVSPGTPIYTIGSQDDLKININVSENLISDIITNQKVTIKVDALGNREFKGIVSEVSSSSIKGAGYPIQIKFIDNNKELKSGMTARVNLEISNKNTTGVYAPLSAIGQDQRNQNYVFVIKNIKDGVGEATKIDVTLGEVTDNNVNIKGVDSGDYLITAGITQILDKELVRVPKGVK